MEREERERERAEVERREHLIREKEQQLRQLREEREREFQQWQEQKELNDKGLELEMKAVARLREKAEQQERMAGEAASTSHVEWFVKDR